MFLFIQKKNICPMLLPKQRTRVQYPPRHLNAPSDAFLQGKLSLIEPLKTPYK